MSRGASFLVAASLTLFAVPSAHAGRDSPACRAKLPECESDAAKCLDAVRAALSERDNECGLHLLDLGCARELRDVCVAFAGVMLEQLKRPAQAFDLFAKACHLGHPAGCGNAAIVLSGATEPQWDVVLDFALRTADMDPAGGGQLVAAVWEKGATSLSAGQRERALSALAKTCANGDNKACELRKLACADDSKPGCTPTAANAPRAVASHQETELGSMLAPTKAALSGDGRHLVTVEPARSKGKAGDVPRQVVVHDGKPGTEWDEVVEIAVSADGARVASLATLGGKNHLSVDGKATKLAYDDAKALTIDPAGRVSFIGSKKDDRYIVIDGNAGPAYRSAELTSKSGKPLYIGRPKNDDRFGFAHEHACFDGKRTEIALHGYQASPSGDHVAVLEASGEDKSDPEHPRKLVRVVVDGNPGPLFHEIPKRDPLTFSSNGKHHLYTGIETAWQKRLIATRNSGDWTHEYPESKHYLVVDGEKRETERVCGEPMAISDDGAHWACFSAGKLVVDGTVVAETSTRHYVKRVLALSSSGRVAAFAALDSAPDRGVVVTEENKLPFKELASGVVFSADGKRLAYVGVKDKDQKQLVIDGVVAETALDIREFVFSADGKRFGYVAQSSSGLHVVVDGQAQPNQLSVSRVSFSPDGAHWAYFAAGADGVVAVIDGVRGPAFAEVFFENARGPVWASDNEVEYLARRGGKLFRVRAAAQDAAQSSITR